MPKFDVIVFDFDGTLVDSAPGIILSLSELLKVMGREPLTEEQLRPCVGPPILHFFPDYLGFHGEELDKALTTYREIFKQTALDILRPFPGVIELLRDIQRAGMRTAIATCKTQTACEEQSESLGLRPYINHIKGVDPAINLMEKADILRALMKEQGFGPDQAVMVGDRMFDLCAAKEVGMTSIGVLYGGCGSVEEMTPYEPMHIVDSVEQLREVLLGESGLAENAV